MGEEGRCEFCYRYGSHHGAQACKIVGLFLLSLLDDLPNFRTILYRDGGLGITTSSPGLQEKLKQSIVRIFAQQDLNITIKINLSRVDYLDITMDLGTGIFKPYSMSRLSDELDLVIH